MLLQELPKQLTCGSSLGAGQNINGRSVTKIYKYKKNRYIYIYIHIYIVLNILLGVKASILLTRMPIQIGPVKTLGSPAPQILP